MSGRSCAEYRVIEARELQRFVHTVEFEGERYGAGISFILVDLPPGSGVRLHRHSYAEPFIVQEGRATYTVGSSTLEVKAPRILLVPAATPHASTPETVRSSRSTST